MKSLRLKTSLVPRNSFKNPRQERGFFYQHAPVFMGPANALEGSGFMLVSGDEELIKRLEPELSKMTGKLLPMNSNQRYNAYLKEIADLCGIRKKLTTHTARHTFATTVLLTNDVPMETAMELLGHTDIRTTQIYGKIVQKKISIDVTALRKKLFPSKVLKTNAK